MVVIKRNYVLHIVMNNSVFPSVHVVVHHVFKLT